MDEQLVPLVSPFEVKCQPASPTSLERICQKCRRPQDGLTPGRTLSVDHGTGNSPTAKPEKTVVKKCGSSNHKFTIINYGRSSIPNSYSPPGSSPTIDLASLSTRKDDGHSRPIPHLENGRQNSANRIDHEDFARDSVISHACEQQQQQQNAGHKVQGRRDDVDFNFAVVVSSSSSSSSSSRDIPDDKLAQPAPTPAEFNGGKSSPTSFLNSVQTGKYQSGQQSTYWKNKTSRWNEIAKIGRIFTKTNKLRLIQQSGECNIIYSNVHRKSMRYLTDFFTTLMELKWRYNILIYLVSFVTSWILFALLWLALHCAYGLDENNVPCVEGVKDFKTALLFSIETQQTIGYGSRAVTDRCPFSYFLLMLQSVFGAITQCVVTGIVFSKLARPDKRAETVIFSKRAVICRSSADPSSCRNLEFRVGDIRNSQLIGVRINAVLVRKSFENNGRQVELQQKCLKITTECEDDFYFLAWPIKVIHRIDQSSPFWNSTPQDFALAEFEILIVLEANCESTGGTVQVKTSYLPSEIVFGGKLAPLFTRTKYNGRYKIDYSRFDEIITEERAYGGGGDDPTEVVIHKMARDSSSVNSRGDSRTVQNTMASLALDDFTQS